MENEQCNLAVVGDGAVGKSSIIAAFRDDGFARVYKQTVGIDFYEKILHISGEKYVSLRVWDIGGQSINSRSLQQYLSSSDVVFIVYDVTNPDSFANLDDWLSMVRKYSKSQHIVLIGNKIDLNQQRQIKEDQHFSFIRQNNLHDGLFLSAKTGENVVRAFYKTAGEAIGIRLNSAELAIFDKVLRAHIDKSTEEGRTDFADEIEKEDLEAEKRKQAQESAAASTACNCQIS